MQILPASIRGVQLAHEIDSRYSDGCVMTLRPSRELYGNRQFLHHALLTAESGFTAQPSFSCKGPLSRTFVCISGEAYALTIDVRVGSPTFLQWQGFYLRPADRRTLIVPRGVALGWQITSSTAQVEIGFTAPHTQADWRWLKWNDEQIDASWPLIPTTIAKQARRSRLIDQFPLRALPRFAPRRQPSIKTSQPTAPAVPPKSKRTSSRKMTNEQAEESPRRVVHRQPGHRLRGDNRPILIIGSSGPLGRAMLKALRPLGTIVAACREPDRESLLPIPFKVDMSRPASLREAIRVLRPSLIVNAAAIGDIDAAEAEPRRAQLVNANAPAILAEEALRIDAGIVHFCSDMVFNGLGERPFRENDLPCPLNLQARTRLVGTQAIRTSGAKHLVLRSGWLYSSWSDNFVKRIVELISYRNSLTLPADYCGCPTSIDWLAETLARILSQAEGDYTGWLEKNGGLYHLSMLGYASRVEVADQVVAICKSHGVPLTINNVRGLPLAELPSVAKIPANCKLDSTKIATTFGLQLPRWQDEMRIQVSRMLGESIAAEQVA